MADLEIPSVPIGRRIEAFGLYLTLGAAFGIIVSLWPFFTDDIENQFSIALILTPALFFLGIFFQGFGRILTVNEIKLKLLLER